MAKIGSWDTINSTIISGTVNDDEIISFGDRVTINANNGNDDIKIT